MYYGNMQTTQGIKYLLIITVGVFALQIFPVLDRWLFLFGALKPTLVVPGLQIWRLVTYLFLHGGIWHVLFNMLALWMFGIELEQMWGTRKFLSFYAITGIGSGVVSLLLGLWSDPFIIGASGAVLGILTAFAYYFPERQILIFFLFPVPARFAVLIFGFISLILAYQNTGGIAHLTHLGGIVIALLYLKFYNDIIAWFYRIRAKRREKKIRQRSEQKIERDKYFEEVIDPILKKISEKGMDSLTSDELEKLKSVSRKK